MLLNNILTSIFLSFIQSFHISSTKKHTIMLNIVFAHFCGPNGAADCIRGIRKYKPIALIKDGPKKFTKTQCFLKNVCFFVCGMVWND